MPIFKLTKNQFNLLISLSDTDDSFCKVLEMTESMFAASVDIYPYAKKQQFSPDILLIQYWDLLLASLDLHEQKNMNGLNKLHVFMDVQPRKKINFIPQFIH